MSTYTLPTTGWVVLHTITRDGQATGMDVTEYMPASSEEDAVAAFNLETERLHSAPRNVVHDRTLVLRVNPDGAGDVRYAESLGLRGSGCNI